MKQVLSEGADRTDDNPDECCRFKQTPEPVRATHDLLHCPHGEAESDLRPSHIVCRAAGNRGESQPGECEQQRRVGELRYGKASRPAQLATTPKRQRSPHAPARPSPCYDSIVVFRGARVRACF